MSAFGNARASAPPAAVKRDCSGQAGFSLIELLVVILIVGILAAIAIPTFVGQKAKAQDAGGKVLARTAETAIESYATNNNGAYSGATVSTLHSIEPTLVTSSTSQSYLASVSVTANGYAVIVSQPVTGNAFTITKSANTVTRTCSGSGGGCAGGSW